VENEGDISSRKLDEDKRLIDEVNVKMEEIEDELIELMSSFHVDNNAFHQPILCLFQFFQIIIKLSLLF